MAAPFDTSLVCPVLVGRAPQLEALQRLIAQACAGHGQTVLIAGEAGIGKSRLVAETCACFHAHQTQARQPAALVLQGHCFEPDRVLPYAPLLDLLRAFLTAQSPKEIADTLGPAAFELVKLLPELADIGSDLTPGPMLEPDQAQRRLSQAFVQSFVRLAARRPLLIVVEDLHWVDETSLEVLLALARNVPAHAILLLLTYRSDEIHPELAAFLAALDRERLAFDISLAQLARADVDMLIGAIFDLGRPLRTEFLEALYAVTEGNPFFVEETLKSLLEAGDRFHADEDWDRKPLSELRLPRTVQVAVQRRLDQVSQDAREILTIAAVAGRRFDFTLLQELTGRDEADLIRLMKQLIKAQLVVEESADIFAFRHALTRQAVEADLLARERRTLHRQIAEAIERCYADARAAHLADLARHFYAAEVWNSALEYARRAGKQAQALYAPRAAVEQFTHAIDAAQRMAGDLQPDMYRARGQMYEVLGEFDAAREDYTQALSAAHAARDRAAEWQGLLDLGWLWTGRDYERAGDYFRQAVALARTMGDPSILAQTLNRVGNWHTHAEQPLEGLRYHQEALTIFQALDERPGLAATLDLLGITSFMGGDAIAGVDYYDRAIQLFRELGDRHGLTASLAPMLARGANYMHSTMVAPIAALDSCLREGEEALAAARGSGWRAAEAHALMFLGLGLGPRGAYTRALGSAQTGLRIAIEIEHQVWIAGTHFTLSALYLDLFALRDARRHAEQSLKVASEIGSTFLIRSATSFLASTYIAQGDLAQAEPALDAALGLDAPMQTLAQRLIWCARAELALARGEPGAALQIVERLIASAAHVERGEVIARLWRLRAEALAALGRFAEAETALLAAQARARAQGTPPMLWRVLASLGKLYQAQGRRDQAAQAFADARAIVADLAEDLPDAVLRDTFLREATARIPRMPPPSPLRAAKQTYDGLTAREREVAALIAQGKSNRAIADALVVSERTVAKHVENILSKLDFTARTQIAAWSVEKGLAKRDA